MKTKRLILILSMLFLLCLTAAGGVFLYLHRHPEEIQAMLERSLSAAIGADLSIGSLSCSADPLSFSAGEILIRPKGGGSGSVLRIPSLSARMELQGPLGRRTLAIQELRMPGFSLIFSGDTEWSGPAPDPKPPSLAMRAAIRLIALLLFRDIRIERGSIGDGFVLAEFEAGSIRLHRVRAEFHASRPIELTCGAEVRIPGIGMVAHLPQLRIEGSGGFSPSLPWSGDLAFERGTLNLPGVTSSDLSGRAHVVVNPGRMDLALEPLDLAASSLVLSLGGRRIGMEGIRVRAPRGVVDPARNEISFPELTIDSSVFRELRAGLEFNAKEGRATIMSEKAGLWGTLLDLDLIPSGWRFHGEDALRLEAVVDRKGWSFSGSLGIRGMGFQDPRGGYIGEGIGLRAEWTAKAGPARSDLDLKYSVKTDQGEVLLDRTYVDLGKTGFHASGGATYETAARLLRTSIDAGLDGLLSLSARGVLDLSRTDPALKLAVHIPESRVEPVFRQFVSDPFKKEIALLNGMDVSGLFSADLELGTGDGWFLKGRCRLNRVDLSAREPSLSLRGVRLDLPLLLGKEPAGKTDGAAKGGLYIDAMELPFLPRQPLDIEIARGPNSLSLNGPITLQVEGGEVRVGSISLTRLDTRPVVRTSLSVEALDLGPVLSKLWPAPPGATLTGRLDPVHFEGGIVSSHGELRAGMFGGEAVIEHIGLKGLSASSPVLSLDVRWEDVSLLDMSRDTPFGRIQGVMRGHIKDLEIVHSQPQRFDLFLETVEKKGVPQKISIDAVDNIARIGAGQSPFMGAAGVFSKFFKEFAYSKIGIRASLENDTFRINGTIREGGVEYLVKRGSFSGVNVVNQNPDNRISFKDMLKRIRRVGSSGNGPVIR
jgi:hypothetical protein